MNSKKVMIRGASLFVVLATVGVWGVSPAAADDFRIDNRVYAAGQTKPSGQSTTIFYGGLVYDFMDEPAEVTIFDRANERFTLLDLRRRLQTDLTTKEVLDFVGQIKQRAIAHKDPLINFLGEPKFEEESDPNSPEMTLKSPWMTYQVKLLTAGPGVVEQYREFSDWYARLNTVLNPGSKPPFARLMLNEVLARRRATAREVQLTLAMKSPAKPITVRSQHDLIIKLTEVDVEQVAKTREFLRTFKTVNFEQYRKAPQR